MINILTVKGDWQDVKDAAMNTIGKNSGKYPSSDWKRRMLMAEHSPIRRFTIAWMWEGIKYWVSVHFVRHKYGIEHWVSTQRPDRTGVERDSLPQNTPVNHSCEANAQAIINISRKRMCNMASKETRNAWLEVKKKIAKVEPELASVMVRECVYKGFCPEMNCCGFVHTKEYKKELDEYRAGYEDRVYKESDRY